jgi:hypothetical protein
MAYNTMHAPILLNYGQAKDWHDKTPPIRGNKDNVRPLGSRRHWHMGSISMDGENVVLNYYNSPVVTWHPDDSLTVQSPPYASAYEPDKMIRYLPPYLAFKWNQRRLVVVNELTEQGVLLGSEPIKLKPTGVTGWQGNIVRKYEFEELPEAVELRKKRGVVGKIIKTKFKSFYEWLESTKDIMPPMPEEECDEYAYSLFEQVTGVSREWIEKGRRWYEQVPWTDENRDMKQAYSEDHNLRDCYPMGGRNSWNRNRKHAAGIRALYDMMMPENQEQWYAALCIVARANTHRYWGTAPAPCYKVNPVADVHKYIERIVCFVHRDEVFERVTLPAGAIPKRTHHEFFKQQELKFFIEKSDKVSVISN